ncbi:diaminopimelate epimerase [Methanobacterium sp. SMA-27]|uniref:diaminopimelate epimerase n=1 Tax=Methanobacterium sp. SMA-27 TaxID=1495336 RepID=UPI00064E609B|nr:diaminopimelate epimerase [Methanobacterium sp. SMA-27]
MSEKTLVTFSKMHGLGNDYIVIDESNKIIIPEEKKPEIVEEICRRGFSVGADGVIFVTPASSDIADIRFRIFNSDGSEAEMCGNGIRCFVKYVYENDIFHNDQMLVETLGGIKEVDLDVEGEEVRASTVDMGVPNFKTTDIPMISDKEEFLDSELIVKGKPVKITAVNVGNPHAVIFTDNIQDIKLNEIGPLIENHPAFPQKTNVHFVNIINRNEIEMITWERGAGFTFACGTGATSCVMAGFKLGILDEEVEVHLPGGELLIIVYEVDNEVRVFMEGESVLVFDGVMEIEI